MQVGNAIEIRLKHPMPTLSIAEVSARTWRNFDEKGKNGWD
jgi:hypothetical protein